MNYRFKYYFLSSLHPATIILGTFLPILLGVLFTSSVIADVPDAYKTEVYLGMYFTFLPMIITIYTLNGYIVVTANEKESNIPFRLKLFGISEVEGFIYKIFANFLVIIFSVFIYTLVMKNKFDLQFNIMGNKYIMLYIFLVSISYILFLILSQSIVNIFKTSDRSMSAGLFIYFVLAIISNMFGKLTLPSFLKKLSNYSPLTYITEEYVKVFKTEEYNYSPMIHCFIVFTGIVILLYYISLKVGKNK